MNYQATILFNLIAGSLRAIREIDDETLQSASSVFCQFVLLYCALERVDTLNAENKHFRNLPEVQKSWAIMMDKLQALELDR